MLATECEKVCMVMKEVKYNTVLQYYGLITSGNCDTSSFKFDLIMSDGRCLFILIEFAGNRMGNN